MKRILLAITAILFFTSAYSQEHIEFMGISLGENYKAIHEHLTKEGYELQKTKKEDNCMILYFYQNGNRTISAHVNQNLQIVTTIFFVIHCNSKSDRNTIFEIWWDILNDKYGTATEYKEYPERLFFFDNSILLSKSYSDNTVTILLEDRINLAAHKKYSCD